MSKGGSFNGVGDMFDGGGAGRAGQRFEGGPMSDILNGMGVKPMGYNDRMGETRPQARPQAPQQSPAGVLPPVSPPSPAGEAVAGGGSAPTQMTPPSPMQDQGGPIHAPMASLAHPDTKIETSYITSLMQRAQGGDPLAVQMLTAMTTGKF
jgi:hypothetical protein